MLMRIAIVYPFGNYFERGWGNSLREELLRSFLKDLGHEVLTLTPRNKKQFMQDQNTTHLFFDWNIFKKVSYKLRSFLLYICHGKAGLLERNILYRFQDISKCKSFHLLIEKMIRNCDYVFLEYPFFASTVVPICKQNRVPCLVTAHDIHAITSGITPNITNKILELELAALKSADYAFCVSPEDEAFLSENGVDAVCVPNPIDTNKCRMESDEDKISIFRRKYGIKKKPICMFVGSQILPNLKAVDDIKKIASHLPEYQFIVSGRCIEPHRKRNIIGLGFVNDDDLKCLYTLCDIVIMPIKTGTGSSLKFIEALAYGKPIIASSIAARGYLSSLNGSTLISDDFDRYPYLIDELIRDEERRQYLSKRAVSIAKRYDYRSVFKSYSNIISNFKGI
jgi:glycosyltransferase involved in cell wall biosynthesis